MNSELNLQGLNILIIDDNPTNLGVLADYLDEYGFIILTSRNGENGIENARRNQPHLILLDVMMPPGIDGFETCRRLKADEATRYIPVIFMTTLASEADKVNGFKVGAVDYVTKPIQLRELLARVTTHLKIQAQAAELTKLNANKDRFFSIIAHDLRGPFMPLMTNLELLGDLADTLTPQEIRDMSGSSLRSAQKVHQLLENLLQWAQLQMGGLKYNPTTFNLYPLAQKSLEVFHQVAQTKAITLVNHTPPNITIYADINMLDAIIRNLINNALKFTHNGGQVSLSATVQPESHKVEIVIADTGVGISPADQQKLFRLEVNHITLGTAQEKGTGLGLIVCKEMIGMHGGKIRVESEVGQGTTVRFTVQASE